MTNRQIKCDNKDVLPSDIIPTSYLIRESPQGTDDLDMIKTQPFYSIFFRLRSSVNDTQKGSMRAYNACYPRKISGAQTNCDTTEFPEDDNIYIFESFSLFYRWNLLILIAPIILTVFSSIVYFYYQRVLYNTSGLTDEQFEQAYGKRRVWKSFSAVAFCGIWAGLILTTMIWYEYLILIINSSHHREVAQTLRKSGTFLQKRINRLSLPPLLCLLIGVILLFTIGIGQTDRLQKKKTLTLFICNIILMALFFIINIYVIWKSGVISNTLLYIFMIVVMTISCALTFEYKN